MGPDWHCYDWQMETVNQVTKVTDSNDKQIFELKLLEIKEVRKNIIHRKIQLDLIQQKPKDEELNTNPFDDIQSPFFP